MFAEAGVPFPSPDPLGPRPYEIGNRYALYIWIAFVLIGGGFLGWFVVFPVIRKAVAWQPVTRKEEGQSSEV